MDDEGQDFKSYTFGFGPTNLPRLFYDERIRDTIVFAIEEFFRKNGKDSLLYLCYNGDGLARQRKITFSKWYNAVESDVEKHDCKEVYANEHLYASILMRADNENKQAHIAAFKRHLESYLEPEVVDATTKVEKVRVDAAAQMAGPEKMSMH